VTEVHWRIIGNLGFKFRSHFTAHCGRRAAGGRRAARRAACMRADHLAPVLDSLVFQRRMIWYRPGRPIGSQRWGFEPETISVHANCALWTRSSNAYWIPVSSVYRRWFGWRTDRQKCIVMYEIVLLLSTVTPVLPDSCQVISAESGTLFPTTSFPLNRCQPSKDSWNDICSANRFLASVTDFLHL